MAGDRPGHQGPGAEGQQQALCAAGIAGRGDQPLRSRLEDDAHARHPAPAGLQRAGRVNDQQVVLAAEISISAPDFGHLGPMLDTTLRELREQGIDEAPEVVLADAGYWHTAQMQQIAKQGIEVLAPPDGNMREGKRPGWEAGFYQIKYNRHIDRFMRRGRAAALSEWRLVTATHNLLKLHNHWITNPA